MKIIIDRTGDDIHISVEHQPLPPERFTALCRLATAAVGGAVILGAIHMIGVWAVAWAVGAIVAVGLYKLLVESW